MTALDDTARLLAAHAARGEPLSADECRDVAAVVDGAALIIAALRSANERMSRTIIELRQRGRA